MQASQHCSSQRFTDYCMCIRAFKRAAVPPTSRICEDFSGAVARKAGSLYLKEWGCISHQHCQSRVCIDLSLDPFLPHRFPFFSCFHSLGALGRHFLMFSGCLGSLLHAAAMLLWQVSDRACDEGVRVMDKGVEKAGAVFDKGALFFKIDRLEWPEFTVLQRLWWPLTLKAIHLQVAESYRSHNRSQLQSVLDFNNCPGGTQMAIVDLLVPRLHTKQTRTHVIACHCICTHA